MQRDRFYKRMLYSVQVSRKEKSFEQDWEAWKSFTEVTTICIWKDEGRCHRRRKAPQEGGIAVQGYGEVEKHGSLCVVRM